MKSLLIFKNNLKYILKSLQLRNNKFVPEVTTCTGTYTNKKTYYRLKWQVAKEMLVLNIVYSQLIFHSTWLNYSCWTEKLLLYTEYKVRLVLESKGVYSVSVGEADVTMVSAKLTRTANGELQLSAEINNQTLVTSSLVMQDSHTVHLFTSVSLPPSHLQIVQYIRRKKLEIVYSIKVNLFYD